MEQSQEYTEEEPSQLAQQLQEDPEELETSTMEETAVDLEQMFSQVLTTALTKTVKQLLKSHRELEDDAEMIQAGVDELYRVQEVRAQHIVGRLKNASSTILTFGDSIHELQEGDGGGNEDEATE
ncbi:hypothetical protein PHYBOEH_003663 [Phytophthora boehmeriae]|uniref:Uncharacterized protein n=1 Tax=Phytophthora boehmeriae TaxID=109152 RepID=A0A8T1WUG9_9STRA|nr:hypothetical protein PHYBOEH_003663 [Phytophthora boehmeriae]